MSSTGLLSTYTYHENTQGILRPPCKGTMSKQIHLRSTRRFTTRGTGSERIELSSADLETAALPLDELPMCRIFDWLRQASLHLLNFMTRPDTIRHLGSHSRESNPLEAVQLHLRHRYRAILHPLLLLAACCAFYTGRTPCQLFLSSVWPNKCQCPIF